MAAPNPTSIGVSVPQAVVAPANKPQETVPAAPAVIPQTNGATERSQAPPQAPPPAPPAVVVQPTEQVTPSVPAAPMEPKPEPSQPPFTAAFATDSAQSVQSNAIQASPSPVVQQISPIPAQIPAAAPSSNPVPAVPVTAPVASAPVAETAAIPASPQASAPVAPSAPAPVPLAPPAIVSAPVPAPATAASALGAPQTATAASATSSSSSSAAVPAAAPVAPAVKQESDPTVSIAPGIVPVGVIDGPGLPGKLPPPLGTLAVRPVMRGTMTFVPTKGAIVISGKWAMAEPSLTWSEFGYKSAGFAQLPPGFNTETPPVDFEAAGHFVLAGTTPKQAPRRFTETAMKLRVGGKPWPEAVLVARPEAQPDAPIVGVRGEGRNSNGIFRLVGSYCPANHGVHLTKIYTGTAAESKAASRGASRRNRQASSASLLTAGMSAAGLVRGPRQRKTPQTLTAAAHTISDPIMRACFTITRRIINSPSGKTFAEPVDPIRHSCPTYFDVVKSPMDLGTVLANIASGKYLALAAWAADVELTFTNAMTFNPQAHWIHQSAAALLEDFRRQQATLAAQVASGTVPAAGGGLSPMHSSSSSSSSSAAAAAAAGSLGGPGSMATPRAMAGAIHPPSSGRHRRATAKAKSHSAEPDTDFTAPSGVKRRTSSSASSAGGSARRASGRTPKRNRFTHANDDGAYGDDDDDDDDSLGLGLNSDGEDDEFGVPASASSSSSASRGGRRPSGRASTGKRQRGGRASSSGSGGGGLGSSRLQRENAELQHELRSMQQQMEEMRAMVSTILVQQQSGGGAGSPSLVPDMGLPMLEQAPAPAPARRRKASSSASSSSAKALTVKEQKELKSNWEKLSEEQEGQALEIIQQSMPLDEELAELDLKDIDAKTLRQVQRFVAGCVSAPKSAPRASPKPAPTTAMASSSSSSSAVTMPTSLTHEPATSSATPAGAPIPTLMDDNWGDLSDDDDDDAATGLAPPPTAAAAATDIMAVPPQQQDLTPAASAAAAPTQSSSSASSSTPVASVATGESSLAQTIQARQEAERLAAAAATSAAAQAQADREATRQAEAAAAQAQAAQKLEAERLAEVERNRIAQATMEARQRAAAEQMQQLAATGDGDDDDDDDEEDDDLAM